MRRRICPHVEYLVSITSGAAACLAVLAAWPAPATAEIGNCALYGPKGQFAITPAQAGQLTVQTHLPAPAWWNGAARGRNQGRIRILHGGQHRQSSGPRAPAGGGRRLAVAGGGQLVLGCHPRWAEAAVRSGAGRDLDHRRAQAGGRFLRALFRVGHRRAGEGRHRARRGTRSRTSASGFRRAPPAAASSSTCCSPTSRRKASATCSRC